MDKEKILKRNKVWRENNREKARLETKLWYEKNKERALEQRKKYYEEHKKYYRSKGRLLFFDARVKAMKYLNPSLNCEVCGIDDLRILTIDHKNNDGYRERKTKTNYQIYKSIIKLPFEEARKGYQVLCHNCNWIRRYNSEDEEKRR